MIFPLCSREFWEYEQVYKILKTWDQFFFVTWYNIRFLFRNCNWKWRIMNRKCSCQEFEHYLILGLALSELAFQIFESRSVHDILIWISRCPYLLCDYLSCSINVNFGCRLKECPGFLKCKSAGVDFGLLTSFLQLFSFMLKAASAFRTYWTLHNGHSIKWMMNMLLQLSLWNMEYSCCVDHMDYVW